jgi:Lrp/AsnC family leucine-responsive transcriptional regulator
MDDLDAADRRLLNELQRDCRQSVAELAEAAHISVPTCQRRLQHLRKARIIEREVAIVDPARSPKPMTAFIDIRLKEHGEDLHLAFEASMNAIAQVTQCYQVTGEVDFVVTMNVGSIAEYHQLAMKHFAGDKSVATFRSVFVVKRAKFNPAIPF